MEIRLPSSRTPCWCAHANARASRRTAAALHPWRRRAIAFVLGALVLAASALPARASENEAPGALEAGLVEAMIAREIGADRRIEVEVGRLDPRLQLAPCERAEPFVPRGTRLWGRSAIGVRCIAGASWSVLLPVQVRVYGNALIASVALPAGSTPGPADFRLEEVDLTRHQGSLIADPAELDGKVLARPIAAGQPLRQDVLRLSPVFAAGDPVRIVVHGDGFTIVGEGVAMAAAADGQRLRVRTGNGRVAVGLVRERAVEIRL